ncbi:MAG: serine/threonine protein kinase, partial [Deltaproteobacteria bacterium]|nr:serine/threonine protein kinase [Deltaproteobacteria bacterium]
MAKTTICRNCGRGLEPSQNFCGGCGASIMADTNPTDPYIGRLIDGKYLIEQLVGTGAMGVVYRAKQVSLNKKVAVKILRRSLLGDATVTLRFKQEARAASRLNHPNTIQVLDFGELPEIGLYMAMEFVEGRDLGKFIQSDLPIAHRRLVHIIKQTLSALDEAHGVGIIHRDVKPANILVCNLRLQPDFVKVLDFGIAKILDPDPS